MGPGVDIWFDPAELAPRAVALQSYPEDLRRQYRAAAVAALASLVYVVLQAVVHRAALAMGAPVPVLIARFQTQGRTLDLDAGDQAIYAIAQAVEAALLYEGPVRMQGLVAALDNGTDARRAATLLGYKKRGAAFALLSAFPLHVRAPARHTIAKVAAIVYGTRPCDSCPALPDADGYLFQVKTYLADQDEAAAGYRVAVQHMRSYVVDSRDAFANPTVIIEEIAELRRLGYTHILLISSHFGNRRINRTAPRHAPHTQPVFVDDVASEIPGRAAVHAAPRRVRRISPAPADGRRIRLRDDQAAAHQDMLPAQQSAASRRLIPVYTFATLDIVGEDTELTPRPQSGFCTYFLATDFNAARNPEWRAEVQANILDARSGMQESLIAMLRALHFLEAEKLPRKRVFSPVLIPSAG